MVVSYRTDALSSKFRFLMRTPSVVLANLVIGENVYPELLQEECTPEKVAAAVLPLLADGPERTRHIEGGARAAARLRDTGEPPSVAAAKIVLDYALAGKVAGDARDAT